MREPPRGLYNVQFSNYQESLTDAFNNRPEHTYTLVLQLGLSVEDSALRRPLHGSSAIAADDSATCVAANATATITANESLRVALHSTW